jgi:hypothetical protein
MDSRYTTVKGLIESNKIKDFQSIFLHIPASVVANDCGVSVKKLEGWVAHPENIELGFVFTLSELLECDALLLSF